MRVSMDQSDVGYNPYAADAVKTVFVDGVEIPDVLTADDKEGIVVYFPRDDKGELILDGDEVVTTQLQGDVRIVLKKGWYPAFLTRMQ